MFKIMTEGFQIINREVVHIHGVVLLLADSALKPLETLNLPHQSPYRCGLPFVEILVGDVLFNQLRQFCLLYGSLRQFVRIRVVKAEDGLFQPVARCPLVVFLRHRAAQVMDGIVQCPALLVTNHSHAALVALPVRIPIGWVDG